MAKELREKLLFSILSQPSAPFREGHVIATIKQALTQGGVPHFADPHGNLILGVANLKEYRALLKKDREPLRVFMAHMDHPGFHGAEWLSETELRAKWHGGAPTQKVSGAPVWLANANGWAGQGEILTAVAAPSGRALTEAVIRLPSGFKAQHADPKKLFGGFKFREPVWKEGEIIYTKAADDLVGAFSIVSVALDLWRSKGKAKKRPPFLGLLTRAEEVGFIGALAHFQLGWLQKSKRKVICVSLETSRTFPGAEIGKGPVVRLGDKATVFDPTSLRVFTDVAAKVLPNAHQRRIMDGGTCEATAATVYGITAIGISVPLGNYHNESFEGGPDSAGPNGPGPEFVHQQDVAGMVALCHGLMKPNLPWNDAWAGKRKEIEKDFKEYRALLRTGP